MSKISFIPSKKENVLTAQTIVALSSSINAAFQQFENRPQEKSFIVSLNGRDYEVTLLSRKNGNVVISLDGETFETSITPVVQRNFSTQNLSIAAPKISSPLTQEISSDTFNSPIAGTVTSISVKKGETVSSDTLLCIIEAMKMENTMKAGSSFIIEEVLINPGDVVKKNQALFKKKV